jgi:hypothetical protein
MNSLLLLNPTTNKTTFRGPNRLNISFYLSPISSRSFPANSRSAPKGVKHFSSSCSYLSDNPRKPWRIDASDPFAMDTARDVARASESGEAVENYYAEKIDTVNVNSNNLSDLCHSMNKSDLGMAIEVNRVKHVESIMDQRDKVYALTGFAVNAPVDPNNSGFIYDSESESELAPLPDSYERKGGVHLNNNAVPSNNPVEPSAANPVVPSNNPVEPSAANPVVPSNDPVEPSAGNPVVSSTSENRGNNFFSTNLPDNSGDSFSSNYFPQDSSDVHVVDYNTPDNYEE